MKENRFDLIATTMFFLIGMVILLPVFWMIIVAFKPYETEAYTLSGLFGTEFTLDNINKILQTSKVGIWILNSFLISFIQTIGGVLVASATAFALSIIKFKGAKIIYFIILIGLMIPIEAMIIPTYQLMIDLKWINSYSGLIAPGIAMPLAVIIFKQFYDGIPRELVEAAKIDGANIFFVWIKLFMPLSKNTMSALSIFLFIQSWNNYLWPMLVGTKAELMTLTVALPIFQSTFSTDLTMPMMANLFASVPAIILFLIFQKQIERGIAMTGIK